MTCKRVIYILIQAVILIVTNLDKVAFEILYQYLARVLYEIVVFCISPATAILRFVP